MRRTKMVLAVVGLMITMFVVLAAPAMADDDFDFDDDNHHNRFFDDDFDFDDFEFDDFDFDQDADSGDVDQSFVVTNTGDNSNQCVGIQGVANTGNAQNQLGVTQFGSDADDFEFDDVGSTIEVSPSNTTRCDQQVNQAASATG